MKNRVMIVLNIVALMGFLGFVVKSDLMTAVIRRQGQIVEYNLSRCKPLPDHLRVDVRTVEDHTHSNGAVRRIISLNSSMAPKNQPYAIGYGTLDHYTKIDVKNHSPEMSKVGNRVHINLTYHQPTIWDGDDYVGIRVFDAINCYNVDATPFKETEWIVVLGSNGDLNSSTLEYEPTFDDCPLCENLQQLEPATIIYVETWDAAEELLDNGNVGALVIDERNGRGSDLLGQNRLETLFLSREIFFYRIDDDDTAKQEKYIVDPLVRRLGLTIEH